MIKTFAQWSEEYLASYPTASEETMQYLYGIYLLSMGVGTLPAGLLTFEQFNAVGGPLFMQRSEEERRTFYKNYVAGGPSTLALYAGNPFATITGPSPAPTPQAEVARKERQAAIRIASLDARQGDRDAWLYTKVGIVNNGDLSGNYKLRLSIISPSREAPAPEPTRQQVRRGAQPRVPAPRQRVAPVVHEWSGSLPPGISQQFNSRDPMLAPGTYTVKAELTATGLYVSDESEVTVTADMSRGAWAR